MAELQAIPARHGVATFVPAGRTIKIVNTSGSQVVDTWAFALPKPEPKNEGEGQEQSKENKQDEAKEEEKPEEKQESQPKPKATANKKKKNDMELPSQEDAEKATREGQQQGEETSKDANTGQSQQKNTWSSYIPSIGWRGGKKTGETQQDAEQRKENSRTWGSYFPSGKAFGSYVPQSASNTVSAFTTSHKPDPNKSYVEQLQAFSKTPVGAAGLSAITGSGYGGSLYAGYQAWNAENAPEAPPMEYMSMPHSRAQTLHMRPRVNDIIVSNMRQPMLTLVEDSSSGIHDTLIPACDPFRYKGLGVEKWEEHGSCAENLVLALKELNERAGLKGAKGVGAEVTINSVPAPLNLFMNIPWDEQGDLSFSAPKNNEGDYVRLRAERDVVVVMSACPNDIQSINNGTIQDGHFLVEDDESAGKQQASQKGRKPVPARRRPTQRRVPSQAQSTATTETQGDDAKSEAPPRRPPPKKLGSTPRKPGTQAAGGAASQAKPEQKKTATKAAPTKVTPTEKQGEAKEKAEGAAQSNGAPPERKKPRKLAQRPKKEAAQEKKDG